MLDLDEAALGPTMALTCSDDLQGLLKSLRNTDLVGSSCFYHSPVKGINEQIGLP